MDLRKRQLKVSLRHAGAPGEASLRVRPDQAQIQLEFVKVERRSDDAQGRRGSERAVTFALEG